MTVSSSELDLPLSPPRAHHKKSPLSAKKGEGGDGRERERDDINICTLTTHTHSKRFGLDGDPGNPEPGDDRSWLAE